MPLGTYNFVGAATETASALSTVNVSFNRLRRQSACDLNLFLFSVVDNSRSTETCNKPSAFSVLNYDRHQSCLGVAVCCSGWDAWLPGIASDWHGPCAQPSLTRRWQILAHPVGVPTCARGLGPNILADLEGKTLLQ